MARITVQLGSLPTRLTSFTIDCDDIDRDDPDLPNLVFEAANRISVAAEDIDLLPFDSQKRIRQLIDAFQAPSMSVGDVIIVDMDGGLRRRQFTVLPVGFFVEDIDVIINRSKPEEASS